MFGMGCAMNVAHAAAGVSGMDEACAGVACVVGSHNDLGCSLLKTWSVSSAAWKEFASGTEPALLMAEAISALRDGLMHIVFVILL